MFHFLNSNSQKTEEYIIPKTKIFWAKSSFLNFC